MLPSIVSLGAYICKYTHIHIPRPSSVTLICATFYLCAFGGLYF